MILNYILIFIASAIIFSLLIPKPQIEDAKAQEFDENGFPKATENSPIPYLVGKTRLESPNTLFAGNFRTVPITERIRTGLFSKKTIIVGYQYYLTFDLGFCLGDDLNGCTLHSIWIDDVEVWTGTVNTWTSNFNISDLELFGGFRNGGGFSSTCRFYPGTFLQPKDSYIDGLADSGGLLTPYRGVCHIVFEDAYIGEQPQLRKISAVISRHTNRLSLTSTNNIIGDGTNVAEAIFDIIVNPWGGLEAPSDLMDGINFRDVGNDVFFPEGQGAAGVIQNASDGESIIKELLKQTDCLMVIDPITNLVQLKPLRKDYDAGTLPVYDESNIKSIERFTQTLWKELVSEVKVGFKNPANNYQDTTAVAQDLAVANITGKLKSTSVRAPFVKDKQLANDIAGRELNQLSQIVTQVRFTMNRQGYQLLPGKVFKWSWDDYGISEMILRVKEIQEGDDNDPEITVDAIRDTYDNTNNPFALPQDTGAVPIVTLPSQVVTWTSFSSHYFMVNVMAAQTVDTSTGLGYPYIIPEPANTASIEVSALYGVDEDTFFEVTPFPIYGSLSAPIGEFDNFSTMVIPSIVITGVDVSRIPELTNDGLNGVRGGGNFVRINGEILGYSTHTDNGGGQVTLTSVYRALLNTKQEAHLAGDKVYFLDAAFIPEAPVATSSASIKLVVGSGTVTLDPAGITPINVPVNTDLLRPDPPDWTLIDGTRTLNDPVDGANITVTWRARDKTLTSAAIATDSAHAEPAGTTYNLSVFNITDGGGAIYTQNSIAAQSWNFNLPSGNGGDTLEIRIYAVNAGLTSLTYDPYRFTVGTPDKLLLSGDQQSGTDRVLLSGDQQSGTDVLDLTGDQA